MSIRIVPAVDIREGRCVNLLQGDYDQETVFADDPVEQAVLWHQQGGEIIHIVDLDGALHGVLCAGDALREMARQGVPFEVGGGIRCMKTLDDVFNAGAQRAILGTAAYHDPDFLQESVKAYPGQIVVGIDAKRGQIALKGWREVLEVQAIDFVKHLETMGVSRIIYTDVLSDGMMKGPNMEATRELARNTSLPVTASGGISSLDDITGLAVLALDGVDEVIVGRALYLGAFTLPEAIEATRKTM